MKLKKYVGMLSLASLLSITTVVNVDALDSNDTLNTEDNTQKIETCCPSGEMKKGPRSKMIFEESITELKKSGILTDDVKKINEYNDKLMEKRKEEMKKKRDDIIDNMVNDKVISKAKGDRLKQSIDDNIEEHMKNHKLDK